MVVKTLPHRTLIFGEGETEPGHLSYLQMILPVGSIYFGKTLAGNGRPKRNPNFRGEESLENCAWHLFGYDPETTRANKSQNHFV